MSQLLRSIVITGASSGIGAALATHYARSGVTLLLIARDANRLDNVASVCRGSGAKVDTARIDVCDAGALAERIAGFDAACPVDLVVANAGVEASLGPQRSAEPLASSLHQIRVNLEGVVATVTPLLEPMRQRRRGCIALVSSLAALEPLPDQPAYSAAKAGVAAWGDAMRPWLGASGISVSVVYPGFVASRMALAYEGWRPFEISPAAAAARIARGLARRQSVIAFPWQLCWLIRLGRLVPRALREAVLGWGFRFEIRDPAAQAEG